MGLVGVIAAPLAAALAVLAIYWRLRHAALLNATREIMSPSEERGGQGCLASMMISAALVILFLLLLLEVVAW